MINNISLRIAEREDTDFLLKMFNNPSVMNYWFSEAYYSKAVLEEKLTKQSENKNSRQFILHNGNEKLGYVALFDIDLIHSRAEFAIMLDPEKQGNGYALPATQQAIDYAFRTLNIHKLFLVVDEINEKAIHVYEKAGFEKEAVLKEEYYVDGAYHNIVYMSVIQK